MAGVKFVSATRVYAKSAPPAVDALDLDIKDGEFMVLVGPSGSGKTTALRMLAGLEPLDGGRVEIGEKNVTFVPPKDRDIAMVFQNYALYPSKTVAENMGFALKMQGVPKEMLEAAELDGAGRIREMTEVIMPVSSPGLVSTALICGIFAWNELFLALNLTTTNAATLPMFLISSVPQEGLYLAHLSAAATVASVPVIIVGWIAQRSLVRGLSMGAIK